MKQKIYILLTILCMAGIFAFSSRDGNESTADSYRVGMIVGRMVVPGFKNWDAEKQLDFAKKIDHPVRKTAHATEYAVLAFLVFGALGDRKRLKLRLLLAQRTTSFYARTDEIHQLFVPGRSGKITDVLIDSAGAFVCLAVIYVTVSFIRSKTQLHRIHRD